MIEFEEDVADNLEELKAAAFLILVSVLGFLAVVAFAVVQITLWLS